MRPVRMDRSELFRGRRRPARDTGNWPRRHGGTEKLFPGPDIAQERGVDADRVRRVGLRSRPSTRPRRVVHESRDDRGDSCTTAFGRVAGASRRASNPRRFVPLCLGGGFLPREQQDAESSRLEGGFY
jgi:hypothetical protein